MIILYSIFTTFEANIIFKVTAKICSSLKSNRYKQI